MARTAHTVRRWRWRPNPLRRRSDVLEAWLGLGAVLLVVVAAPLVAALTATGVAGDTLRQRDELHRAVAVLTAPATDPGATDGGSEGLPDAGAAEVATRARWTALDGTTRTGVAPAPVGSEIGDRVPIWLDDEGERHGKPPSASQAWSGGIMTGTAAGVLVGLLIVGTRVLLRSSLDAWRERRWAREWSEVGPRWTNRPSRGGGP